MTNISDTAYLVALCRAIETERAHPLFRDPLARRLAGGKGVLHAAVLGNIKQIATAIAIRTHVVDEMLVQAIQRDRIDAVLNLGAGLDTRPYRLSLPASLTWIEVDLPDIMAYKEKALESEERPCCALQQVRLDLADLQARNTLFEEINGNHKRVLVISEGILGYLTEAQVAALATDLNQQPKFYGWILEFTAKNLLDIVQKQQQQKIFSQYFTNKSAAFSFAPEEFPKFFQTYGWQVADFQSIWEATLRCKRASGWDRFQELMFRCFAQEDWRAFRASSAIVMLNQTQQPLPHTP